MALQPLDEGFSEDTHSQPGGDESRAQSQVVGQGSMDVLDSLLKLTLEERYKVINDAARTLTTPLLFKLHLSVGSMVYFDPVFYLPNELILHIFSHLSSKDLMTASLVSKPWRERSHDERLWHNCFAGEGWVLDREKLSLNEEFARKNGQDLAEKMMRSGRVTLNMERKETRKRPRDEAFSENDSIRAHASQDGGFESEEETVDVMEGIEEPSGPSNTGPLVTVRDAVMDWDEAKSGDLAPFSDFSSRAIANSYGIRIEPSVFTPGKDPRVSWSYLYKQRRRLERNWEQGKFVTLRLPLPEFADEGHSECVYTIQHSGNHLVSGSRDRTIRIWDLETCRLIGKPLQGHEASVLCLQFDDRPGEDHDVIISGGSDNYVIVWRFSTGEIINKMTTAHEESVLNLRFDDRYLVTCSKDKTIKLWNRKQIARNDRIIPLRALAKFGGEADIGIPLNPYTLLDTLIGHAAAVNAVQIHEDAIVSASGDRTIRSWDIPSSTIKKTYVGHTKGIACVQFDGRRIVSGSSDNSVQIFDYESQACIATLDGHQNLVRTVQARFGDLDIMSDEDLWSQSREADRRFLRAVGNGMEAPGVSRRGRRRNAGSSRPEDMLSYGTRIPPGGGGSKWAKIVSGSYDENVIIWKRDAKGDWRPNQRLTLNILNQSSNGRPSRSAPPPLPLPPNPATLGTHGGQAAAAHHAHGLLHQAAAQLNLAQNILQQPALANMPTVQLGNLAAVQNSLTMSMHAISQQQLNNVNQQNQQHGNANQAGGPNQQQQQQAQQQQQINTAPATGANLHPAFHNGLIGNAGQVMGNNQAAQAANANPPHHHHHHHHHHHGQHHHHAHQQAANHHAGIQRDTNRVFKLQFDTRRIIACSQNKVIVGWDFANGDKDLEWIGNWSEETA